MEKVPAECVWNDGVNLQKSEGQVCVYIYVCVSVSLCVCVWTRIWICMCAGEKGID